MQILTPLDCVRTALPPLRKLSAGEQTNEDYLLSGCKASGLLVTWGTRLAVALRFWAQVFTHALTSYLRSLGSLKNLLLETGADFLQVSRLGECKESLFQPQVNHG